MLRKVVVLIAVLAISMPARANLVSEPTFAEKMRLSELVVIATVTAVSCPNGRRGSGSNATLSVEQRLKGQSPETIQIATYHRVAEFGLHCLDVGATYLLFLRRSATDGTLVSGWGAYGVVRVGGPPDRIRIVPDPSS